MEQVKTIDEARYISFWNEWENEKISFKKYNGASPKQYLRKIDFDFKQTEKEHYHYIDDNSIYDPSAMEIDVEVLEVGQVYTIQATEYISNKYSDVYSTIIFITDKSDDEIRFIKCANERVAKKEQRIYNKQRN